MNGTNYYDYDVVIIGGGTAGVAAAYALKDSGKKVLIIEQQKQLGGTAVEAYVYDWIAGVFPEYLGEVFKSLKDRARGNLDNSWLPGCFRKDGKNDSLENSIQMVPDALAEKYEADLSGSICVWVKHSFVDIQELNDKTVTKIKVKDENKNEKIITAKFFIDSSADAVLCRANDNNGEYFFVGRDKRNLYGESLAAENPDSLQINEPSLFFLLSMKDNDDAVLEKITTVKLNPDSKSREEDIINEANVNRDGYAQTYIEDPDKKDMYICNPMTGLGITGMEIINSSIQAVYDKSYKKVLEYWKFIKLNLNLQHDKYKMNDSEKWFGWFIFQRKLSYAQCTAPMLGIRETYRVKCKKMLIQNDLCKQIDLDNLNDYIAIGTHGIDIHNRTGLDENAINTFNSSFLRPYGVPYKCILPERFNNVLIACRAFGASQIAASSFRTNKAMSQLGWAAGNAVKYCINNGKSLNEIDGKDIQGEEYINFKYYVDNIKNIIKTIYQ